MFCKRERSWSGREPSISIKNSAAATAVQEVIGHGILNMQWHFVLRLLIRCLQCWAECFVQVCMFGWNISEWISMNVCASTLGIFRILSNEARAQTGCRVRRTSGDYDFSMCSRRNLMVTWNMLENGELTNRGK